MQQFELRHIKSGGQASRSAAFGHQPAICRTVATYEYTPQKFVTLVRHPPVFHCGAMPKAAAMANATTLHARLVCLNSDVFNVDMTNISTPGFRRAWGFLCARVR
jgi:hypothetical protein